MVVEEHSLITTHNFITHLLNVALIFCNIAIVATYNLQTLRIVTCRHFTIVDNNFLPILLGIYFDEPLLVVFFY